MMKSSDPTLEDVGNIVLLEHVNLTVPDQLTATLFYVVGLGFTRDPYLNVGLQNMWVNVGEQQFHLPTRSSQVISGTIGLVVSDLEALERRLGAVAERLSGTRFTWAREDGCVTVTCPWGNHFRCHAPGAELGDMSLGLPYVEFLTAAGTTPGIARFYEQVMGAPAALAEAEAVARVSIGTNQWLVFRETDEPLPHYDGHHIAIYVANFSNPYQLLRTHELITGDIANHQFRFQDIVDLENGQKLFALEHEVRSLRHPMYRRPLVNRDPSQTMQTYARGRDAFVGA